MPKTITLGPDTTNVEPIEIMMRLVDAMATPATKGEVSILASYGFTSTDVKENTHFENSEIAETIVKFKLNGRVMWFRSADSFSLFDSSQFVGELYEKVEAEEDTDIY